MNIARTSTTVIDLSLGDIIEMLKERIPDNPEIQAIPSAKEVVMTGPGEATFSSVRLRWTRNVGRHV